MFETQYRRELDQLSLPEERLEQLITAMGQTEPQKPSQRAGKAWKTVLLAAALCVALVATALAISPTLRDALDSALGAFAPYSREIKGICVIDQGIEVRVVSALSDGNAARVYFEVQDLEGDRLGEHPVTNLGLEMPRNNWVSGIEFPAQCIGYDRTTRTALFVAAFIGDGPPDNDLTFTAYAQFFAPDGSGYHSEKAIRGEWSLEIPLENAPTRTVDLREMGAELGGVTAKELSLTSIGATIESDPNGFPWTMGYKLTTYLSDGTLVRVGKQDSTYHSDEYATDHWSFPEPIDPEDVVAIAIGQWYVPIEGGVAGQGHWLPQLP